ncbi:SBBP repeat-containing protein [Nitrosopumilus sp.]|uniref:SBBP repeat-containing protein n=1 Tax=Nitrosopumilus sp. TaxID=2024843 RepID=UPI003B5B35AA
MSTRVLMIICTIGFLGFSTSSLIFAEENEKGLFLDPIASVVDSKRFVYVVDSYNNNTVQKFDSNGKFLSIWKTKNVDNNTMFDRPVGIAVDSSDNVYVVSSTHNKIKKLSDSGYIASSFGKHGYKDENGETLGGEFSRPLHIAIDSKDAIPGFEEYYLAKAKSLIPFEVNVIIK